MICSEPTTSTSDPAETGLQPAGDGKMWLDRRYHPELKAAGLTRFEDVMTTSDGRCLRALADRENWRLELRDDQRRPRGVYLKKHHVRTWLSRLWAKLGIAPGETAGRVEARNVGRMAAHGIDVMHLVAYGEKLHADGRLESFVLTEELEGYTQLDHFLSRRFAPLSEQKTRRRDPHLITLIRRIAEIAGRFHAAGYNHRDFYCGHFFIREPVPGEFDVKMIDLQRVQRRRFFRRRWIVKDLAQLVWSAHRDWISGTQKMAFLRHYLGVKKLRPADKRLVRSVLAKQRRMERRLGYGP